MAEKFVKPLSEAHPTARDLQQSKSLEEVRFISRPSLCTLYRGVIGIRFWTLHSLEHTSQGELHLLRSQPFPLYGLDES